MTRAYVDLHILQDLPPSNINRDDNGTPKQAVYGGVDRLRVSSQAWKRATRLRFQHDLPQDSLGLRTRRLHGLLTELVEARGIEHDSAATLAQSALGTLKITPDKKKAGFSSYLLFAGRSQLEQLAGSLADRGLEGTDVAGLLGSVHPLDVALFGRMVADMTQLSVDAAVQVGHAISTHAAPTQFDYFTAVDDLQDKDEAGAGMIGTVEFNSATVYRFATLSVHQLIENMADREKAIDGVGHFISAFTQSMPSGHQNSFAALTRPALVLAVIREDQPVSFVSAFEAPIRTRGAGYLAASQKALAAHYQAETQRWGDTPRLVVASYTPGDGAREALDDAFGASVSLADLLTQVRAVLSAAAGLPAGTSS